MNMKNISYAIVRTRASAQDLFYGFKDDPMPFLLESSLDVRSMGRYSFFGSDPFLTLTIREDACCIEEGGRPRKKKGTPLLILSELLDRYHMTPDKRNPVPFSGGSVGFFGYDFGFLLERIRREKKSDASVPLAMFGFYDSVVCLDHWTDRVIVFSSGFPEKKSPLRRRRAEERLRQTLKKLEAVRPCREGQEALQARLRYKDLFSNFTRNRYMAALRRAKEYIACGDIYQVNLAQRFQASLKIDDWALYQRLIRNFPVPFSAFLKTKEFSILSASPEKFLEFDGRRVTTRPMKGTRKRTGRTAEDRKMKKELWESKKEKAELLMVVDLERNDLGRVCAYGSINVSAPRVIETYANVFQATAEVQGLLHRDKDRLDLIRACFPGGSVTGCPKIRAMEIIEELEPDPRGVYTGSLGYLSFHNTMQFNMLIRSFLKKHDDIFFHVGGGIVADSEPGFEYEETLVKAKALQDALMKG